MIFSHDVHAGLNESQVGIKMAGEISITDIQMISLMAESKEDQRVS